MEVAGSSPAPAFIAAWCNGNTSDFDPEIQGSNPCAAANQSNINNMKSLLNWRQWVLYALFAGCFIAFLMMCDETDNTAAEFITMRIKAVVLMSVCGYTLCKLTGKWEREGKIKIEEPQ